MCDAITPICPGAEYSFEDHCYGCSETSEVGFTDEEWLDYLQQCFPEGLESPAQPTPEARPPRAPPLERITTPGACPCPKFARVLKFCEVLC